MVSKVKNESSERVVNKALDQLEQRIKEIRSHNDGSLEGVVRVHKELQWAMANVIPDFESAYLYFDDMLADLESRD